LIYSKIGLVGTRPLPWKSGDGVPCLPPHAPHPCAWLSWGNSGV